MRRLFILLMGLVLAGNVNAGAGREQLHGFLDGLTTLSAHFEQSVLNPEEGTGGQFSGEFMLKRPGRFRWKYTAPYQQDIIADGDWVWVVDWDLEQVSQESEDTALRGTPAVVLLGNDSLDKHFEVIDLGQHQGMAWLELTPRDPDGPFERIQLAFADKLLQRMETRDRFGHISRFIFSNMRRNPTLDDKLFVYTPTQEFDVFAH